MDQIRRLGKTALAQPLMRPDQACRVIHRENLHLSGKIRLSPRESIETGTKHQILTKTPGRRFRHSVLGKPAAHREQAPEHDRKRLSGIAEFRKDSGITRLRYQLEYNRIPQDHGCIEKLMLSSSDR